MENIEKMVNRIGKNNIFSVNYYPPPQPQSEFSRIRWQKWMVYPLLIGIILFIIGVILLTFKEEDGLLPHFLYGKEALIFMCLGVLFILVPIILDMIFKFGSDSKQAPSYPTQQQQQQVVIIKEEKRDRERSFKICPHCGMRNEVDAVFCKNCASSIIPESSSTDDKKNLLEGLHKDH